MLLKCLDKKDHRIRIGLGQLHLVLGMIIFGINRFLLKNESGSFLYGFLDGLSFSFLVISGFLNISGLILYRKSKNRKALSSRFKGSKFDKQI